MDRYDDTALGETPPRTGTEPVNVGAPMGKKAGGIPKAVQQADGTANLRSEGMTKSSGRAMPGMGKTRYPAIDRYNDGSV